MMTARNNSGWLKKGLSFLMAAVVTLSLFFVIPGATLPAKAAELPVSGGPAMLSEEQATWKLTKFADNDYKLQNVETGLFMTMDENGAGGYKLYQGNYLGDGDGRQSYSVLYSGYTNNQGVHHFVIINNAFNRALYANNDATGFVYQDGSSWWTPPEGVSSNNNAQFAAPGIANTIPADGEETTFRSAGGQMWLQSGQKRGEIGYDIEASETEKEDYGRWKFIAVSEPEEHVYDGGYTTVKRKYKLQNVQTGLYLTSNGYDQPVTQRVENDALYQVWEAYSYYGRLYFCDATDKHNILTYNADTGIWTAYDWTQYWADARCWFNAELPMPDGGDVSTLHLNLHDPKVYLTSVFGGFIPNETEERAVIADTKIPLDAAANWKFIAVGNTEEHVYDDGYKTTKRKFKLQNALTGLYLTSNGYGEPVTQNSESDKLYQVWEAYYFYGRLYFRDATDKSNILTYSADTGAWTAFDWVQYWADAGCWFNVDLPMPDDGDVLTLQLNAYTPAYFLQSALNPDDIPEEKQAYGVGFGSGTPASADAEKWILDAAGKYFKLRNVETGLNLSVDTSGDAPRLVQMLDSTDTKQQWEFVSYNEYFLLRNVSTNQVIYGEGDKFALKDNGSWWVPPAGFKDANRCQFSTTFNGSPRDGLITTFTLHNDVDETMRSLVLRSGVKEYPAAGADSILFRHVDDVAWTIQAADGAFHVINRYTGLYLTKTGEGKAGLRTADGSDAQKWTVKAGTGGQYIVNAEGGCLDIAADGKVTLAEEAQADTRLFASLTFEDGAVRMLQTLGGRYLVNGFKGFGVIAASDSERLLGNTEAITKYPVQTWKLERSDVKSGAESLYRLRNKASGKYLTVTAAGETVEAGATGTYSQLFILRAAEGGYTLLNAVGTQEVSIEEDGSILAMEAGTGFDSVFALAGEPADQLETTLRTKAAEKYLQTAFWDESWIDTEYTVAGYRSGTPSRQEWQLQLVEGEPLNTYRILNKNTGLYLTMQGKVFFQDTLRTGEREKDQIFRFVLQNYWAGVNYYMLLSPHNKQLVITQTTGEKAAIELRDIQNWDATGAWDPTWSGSNEHLWRLSAGNEAQGLPADGLVTAIISMSEYKIEGEGPDAAERYVTGQKAATDSELQQWVLFSIGSNFAIQNKATGQFLTLNTNNRFVQADFTGAKNQQWALKYDVTNQVYRLANAATGKWLGVAEDAEGDGVKFIDFDANTLTGNTAWILKEYVDGRKTELTGGVTPANYGVFELSIQEPAYVLQGELTGSAPQAMTVKITSPETNGSHSTVADTKIKLQAKVTPPGLNDKVVWTVRSDMTGDNASIEDYQEFDIDAGLYFGMAHLKNTGNFIIRAALASNPAVYDEWDFTVLPNWGELQSVIGQYESIMDGKYTQESYDKLMALVGTAKALVDKGNAVTQAEITAMLDTLRQAEEALQPNPDGGYRKEIVQNLTAPMVIPSEVFKKAKEQDRVRVYNIVDANGKALYSWRFSFDEKSNPNYSVDLGLSLQSDNAGVIQLFTGDKQTTSLNFANTGKMPGNTEVTVYVGDKYEDGSLFSLYYFNPIINAGNLKAKELEVEGGYVTLNLSQTAEYFLTYAGKKTDEVPEPEEPEPEPPATADPQPPVTEEPTEPEGPEENPDAMALKLTLDAVKAAIASSTGETVSIRVNEPGVLTPDMMNELTAAGKKLKIEVADTNGNVYLIWTFGAFTDTSKEVDLGLNSPAPTAETIKGLTTAELFQIVSFKFEQLPGEASVILRNGAGFVPGSRLKLLRYDPQTNALAAEEGLAAISNDGQYISVTPSAAGDYVVELVKAEDGKKPDTPAGPAGLGTVEIALIVAGAIVVAGAAVLVTVLVIRKKKKTPAAE